MLTTPAELAHALANPALVIVDCRFALADPAAGRKAYDAAHLPKAHFADLEQDLSGPLIKGVTGRHPLPSTGSLDALFSRWVLTREASVVLYDDNGGAMASRLWWLLRWAGLRHIALLDGGFKAWQAAGLPTTTDLPVAAAPTDFHGDYPADALISAEDLQAQLDQCCLIDARAEPRFRGEVEPIDPVAGHIPGARCVPYEHNLDVTGRFLPNADLRKRFEFLQDARNPVAYCGSGVTACHNLFAIHLCRLPLPRLYAGSWSEWITDTSRPIAVGPN